MHISSSAPIRKLSKLHPSRSHSPSHHKSQPANNAKASVSWSLFAHQTRHRNRKFKVLLTCQCVETSLGSLYGSALHSWSRSSECDFPAAYYKLLGGIISPTLAGKSTPCILAWSFRSREDFINIFHMCKKFNELQLEHSLLGTIFVLNYYSVKTILKFWWWSYKYYH